ncbi:class I adenylate-forming enzyme family protein [Micromonospora sp. NPDC093277]|uniref:class I adenylate-forming enzyme family protein n=1 Tax=Micromonospora sp. NPDC093277 TaxID=3364291 RepID=UPI003818924F
MGLVDVFAEQTARHRDRTAVGGQGTVLTYGQLAEAADDFAYELRALRRALPGRVSDDRLRVVLSAANSPQYVVAYLGCLRAGAVPFLLDPVLGLQELAAVLDSCAADLLIQHQAARSPSLRPVGEIGGYRVSEVSRPLPGEGVRPELHPTTEVCRFTSGSTGVPHCIEFSGTAVQNAATAWNAASGIGPDDRILCFAGLFNGLAFNTSLLPAFLAGAALWLPAGLPTAGHVARHLREIRPTRLTGFPALYESLLRREAAVPGLADLRVALSSAAPLAADTLMRLRDRHGLTVCNYYGIAETGPLTFDPAPTPDGGLGFALPGVELRADQPLDGRQAGEIRVRSGSMGTSYLNAPGAFAQKLDAQGWYQTSDQGLLRDGRLFLTGRAGKGINIGGRKVDATEVRAALASVPGATEVVVFTVDKENGDPMLVAAVSGPVTATPRQLRAHCHSRLAPYKVPERFLVLPEMPVTGLGKPRMSALRDLARIHADRAGEIPLLQQERTIDD